MKRFLSNFRQKSMNEAATADTGHPSVAAGTLAATGSLEQIKGRGKSISRIFSKQKKKRRTELETMKTNIGMFQLSAFRFVRLEAI
jgi:hypothetical protein